MTGTHIHINSPRHWTYRREARCTSCRSTQRQLLMMFEWYPARWICGGCGHEFVAFDGRQRTGMDQRRKNKDKVALDWDTTMTKEQAIETMSNDCLVCTIDELEIPERDKSKEKKWD